jgi:RNA polymerase primary sigma factor
MVEIYISRYPQSANLGHNRRSMFRGTKMAEIRSEVDTVNYLMKNAGRFPLLTGEQEIELGRQVQSMMKLLALSETDRPEDWSQTVSQGQKAKTRMIKSNLRLVINVAKKYQNMGLPFEDLIQEGSIGLNRGIEKFDPERGYKASTYLFAWIKQAITRAIANTSRTIRLPVHMKERVQKLKQLTREMMKESGRRPSAEALREAMELDEQQWKQLMASMQDAISYDIKVSKEDNETSLADLLPSGLETPQDMLDTIGERDRLEQILCGIDKREAYVLGLRYGLDRGEGRSLAEIGQMLGVSRERVRQIEAKAMRSARKVANQVQMIA